MENTPDTRTKIIRTAASLFQKKGYHAVGINEIIRESGTPKGSLYYHFPGGKEEIAAAAIHLVKDEIRQRIDQELGESDDAVQAFGNYIDNLADIFSAQDCFSISLLALDSAPIQESLRSTCIEAYELWTNAYYQKLLYCGFSSEKARELSEVLQTLIEGAITVSLVRNDAALLRTIARQIPVILQK